MPVPRVAMVDSDVLHFARALLLTKQLSDIPTSMQGFVTWYPKDKTTFLFTNTVREEVAQFQRALLEHPDARFVFVPSELDAKQAAFALQELPRFIPEVSVQTAGKIKTWSTYRLLHHFPHLHSELKVILEAGFARGNVFTYCEQNGIPFQFPPLVSTNLQLIHTLVAGRYKALEQWINLCGCEHLVDVLHLNEYMSLPP
eukprot:TRINITY_DN8036_c0_g1_i9.p1 TRINITY_DN8036_c0_g1~~TRINITY_DN8036_c0_g1_i9.p1  ORF type:complete len:200 (-),score=27.50 TRINITY_DN8036_c0_g1_i9:155-754(-)